MSKRSRWAKFGDAEDGYSWLSIALHWIAALIIIALWLIGSASQGGVSDSSGLVRLHTTVAVSTYPWLWLRILWRFKSGHPRPAPTHDPRWAALGAVIHYLLLGAMAGMLVSGPLMVWTGGDAIHVFDWALESPLPANPGLHRLMRTGHGFFASVIAAGVALHVLGVLKHIVFDRDGTLDRMLVASRVSGGDET